MLPVKTQSGEWLGKPQSLDIDITTGAIVALHVRSHELVSRLRGAEFLIAWSEVIEVTPEWILVMDAAVSETKESTALAGAAAASAVLSKERGVYGGA